MGIGGAARPSRINSDTVRVLNGRIVSGCQAGSPVTRRDDGAVTERPRKRITPASFRRAISSIFAYAVIKSALLRGIVISLAADRTPTHGARGHG